MTLSGAFTVLGDTLAWQTQQSGTNEPNPLNKFVSLMSLILRWETFGVSVPVGILQKPKNEWSKADQWTMWLWATRGSVILVDTIFTGVSAFEANAKYLKTFGPALKTTMGLGLEAVGTVAAVYQLKDTNYSAWVPANEWIRPIPSVFKFLMYFDAESPAWVPVPWLLGIDVLFGIGSSVTQIGGTVYKYQHSS